MQQEEKDEKKQTNKTHHEEEEEEEEHGNVDDKFSRPEQRRNTETNDGEPSIAANNTQRHVGISSGREFLSWKKKQSRIPREWARNHENHQKQKQNKVK